MITSSDSPEIKMFKSAMFKAKKTAPKQPVPKIVYPEFTGATETQSDEFWIAELTKASHGDFPKGVTYTNQTLHHKRRGATHTLELRGVPEEIHNDYCQFMRHYLGILSPQDLENERRLQEEVGPVEYLVWKDVPKKCRKEFIWRYIDSFVPDIIENNDRAEAMFQIIMFGMTLKYITANEFELENNKIVHISNLYYDKDNNRWYFIRQATKTRQSSRAKPKVVEVNGVTLIDSFTQLLTDIMNRTNTNLVIINKVPARYKESITVTPSGTRLSTLTDV